MNRKTILISIFAAINGLIFSLPVDAQEHYATRELAAAAQRHQRDTLFRGVAVSGDLVGLLMKPFGAKYGSYEGAARINFKNRYFPTGEVGYAFADNTGDATGVNFKTQAPYFRVGMDYNFLKRKNTGNRLFGGFRYAFTTFKYDVTDPNFMDPVWGTTGTFSFNDIRCTAHWVELVFGVEAKVWSIFHLGWSARYKVRINQSKNESGEPWYIPGFGKNDTTCWGGTFNVIFDI